ncbi:hypothetical protein [Microbacterium murale]|uniref:FMN-binding domain-containing protein n=1 Tax=Microbacterium murale TaxID=1081040 RepID=A0ABQ1RD76_9MICO|nr:hypothetical protein [Microbacterium murale]GGD66500.1 hypothetical protein GCM10007269_07150 [Microbacterium murale]
MTRTAGDTPGVVFTDVGRIRPNAPTSVFLAPRVSATVGAVILGAGLAGCSAAPDDGTATATPAPTSTATEAPATDGTPAMDYTDGTYEATGWYGSLPSHQDVTLTLEADVVVDVSLTTPAEDSTSLGHQQRFAEAIDAEILGVDIDSIAMDRLAGASGCSEGFMSALAEIKTAART